MAQLHPDRPCRKRLFLSTSLIRIFICCCCLLIQSTAFCQNQIQFTEMEYPGDASRINMDYFKTVLSDTKYVVTAPLRFEKKQWKTVGAVAGMTAVLLVYDKDIQKWSQRNKIDKWNTEYREDDSFRIARMVKPLGDYGQMLLPLSAFYLYGHVRDDVRARRTVLISGEALLISNLIGQAMKRAINRERPSGRGIEHDWGPSSQSTPNQSMPSGHAITAFSLATVFAGQYQHHRWVPPVAYGLATLTAASRVHENRHWTSDVFVGGCIGYFTAKTLLKRHDSKLTVIPVTDGSSTFVNFQYRF